MDIRRAGDVSTLVLQEPARVLLRGRPASPGRATGRVRFVCRPEDMGPLRGEEVILVPELSAESAVAYASAGALIALRGGPLSAGATVARERGFPVVIMHPGSVHILIDGRLVTVDGATGTVDVLT